MAHSKQAKKRVRQAEAIRLHNRSIKSDLRTAIKRARIAITSGEGDVNALISVVESKLDKAAKRNIVPTRRANRLKGRLKAFAHKESQKG